MAVAMPAGSDQMTITIDLPPETEKGFRHLAEEYGQDLSTCARSIIEQQVRSHSATWVDDEEDTDPDALERAIAAMANRTPEEIAEARRQVIVPSKRHLAPGETIFDAVGGKWPGNETDEQVMEALERLS
jgi:hypothetical protein